MATSEPPPRAEEQSGGAGDRSRGAGPAPSGAPADHPLTARVLTAHGDYWQQQGRLRAPLGGGALELPGIRLMASGIPAPQWNNGDVTDPPVVDIDAVRAWYADRRVPWGVRVPAGRSWPYGRHLFAKRCMAVELPVGVRPAGTPPGVTVRQATPRDLETYATIDAAAFEEDEVGPTREWVRPMLSAERFRLVLASLDGEPVGVAYAARTSGAAGETVGVFGVAVRPSARRRGVGAALTSHLVDWGVATGADLAWLNPDTATAGRLYYGLGFEETGGFDVYVDN